MARRSQAVHFKQSVWDRLTRPVPPRGDGVGPSPAAEAERIKDAVREDLELLLNSKCPLVEAPEGLPALGQSLLCYGLPDFSNMTLGDPGERDRLKRTLEAAIRTFEPRLTQVRVTFNPMDQDRSRSALHYRVDALLRLDPAPESIYFDTVLDIGNRAFTVRRDGA